MGKYYCELEQWQGHHWRTEEGDFKNDDDAVAAFLAKYSRLVLRIYSIEFRYIFNPHRRAKERAPFPMVIYRRLEYQNYPETQEVWQPKNSPPTIEIADTRVKVLTWDKKETGNKKSSS